MTRKCIFRRPALYLLPVLFIVGVFSCTKPQINFGTNLSNDNSTNVVSIDTFSVKVSTVFMDSFPASGTGVMLLGQYIDPYFGNVSAKSYSEITFPTSLPTLSVLSVYDSIELIMRINKTFYGDTTKVQRYLVSQLSQVLNYPGTQTAFYNIDSIPYDPTILGSADVQINPTAGFTSQKVGDSLKIRLPDALGQKFFSLLFNQSDTVKTAATFRGWFKGLAIYPDPSMPGAVYGFHDTIAVRMFYHEPGVINQVKTVDFPYVNKQNQFNRVTADRTGTPIQDIGPQHPEIPSTAAGNAGYMQPITSVYVKLLFPTISALLHYSDYLEVLRATLTIKPVEGTYSPLYDLPKQMPLALTDEANDIGSQLSSGNGNLSIDYLYGANTSYTYDITGYIQQQIMAGTENNAKNGLILTIPAGQYNTTFNRLLVGDQFSPLKINQISLNIYYASYY